MTVTTTIKFISDLHGAVKAAVEATQTAIMRAARGRVDMREWLEKALAELRSVEAQVKPPPKRPS